MALLSDADEGEDDGDGDELDDGVDEARSADGNVEETQRVRKETVTETMVGAPAKSRRGRRAAAHCEHICDECGAQRLRWHEMGATICVVHGE